MLPATPGTVTVLPPYRCLRPRPALLHAHARTIVPHRSTSMHLLRALTVDHAIGISRTFASGISLSSSIGLLLPSVLFLYLLSGTPTAPAVLTAPRSCPRPFPIIDRVLRCLSPRYRRLPLPSFGGLLVSFLTCIYVSIPSPCHRPYPPSTVPVSAPAPEREREPAAAYRSYQADHGHPPLLRFFSLCYLFRYSLRFNSAPSPLALPRSLPRLPHRPRQSLRYRLRRCPSPFLNDLLLASLLLNIFSDTAPRPRQQISTHNPLRAYSSLIVAFIYILRKQAALASTHQPSPPPRRLHLPSIVGLLLSSLIVYIFSGIKPLPPPSVVPSSRSTPSSTCVPSSTSVPSTVICRRYISTDAVAASAAQLASLVKRLLAWLLLYIFSDTTRTPVPAHRSSATDLAPAPFPPFICIHSALVSPCFDSVREGGGG